MHLSLTSSLLLKDATTTVLALFLFLSLTFSLLCVFARDEDNGDVASRQSLPPRRQVTKQIMKKWLLHEQMLRYPPTVRMRDVHMLHHTQS